VVKQREHGWGRVIALSVLGTLFAAVLVLSVVALRRGPSPGGPWRAAKPAFEGVVLERTVESREKGGSFVGYLAVRDRDGTVIYVLVPMDVFQRATPGMIARRREPGGEVELEATRGMENE
jgi:hypothetical protein